MRRAFLVAVVVVGVIGCTSHRYGSAESWMGMRPAGAPKPKGLNVTVTATGIKVNPEAINLKRNQEWAIWKFSNVPESQTPRIEYKANPPFPDPVCHWDPQDKWLCESTTFNLPCPEPTGAYEIEYTIYVDGSGVPPLDPKIIVDP